jgi:hypothetical protein
VSSYKPLKPILIDKYLSFMFYVQKRREMGTTAQRFRKNTILQVGISKNTMLANKYQGLYAKASGKPHTTMSGE